MAELTIAKSLNKAYRQVPVERPVFNIFKAQLSNYYEQISPSIRKKSSKET